MADDLGERTEEATPRRREEAREEGNVARSQDAAGAIVLTLATGAIALATMPMIRDAAAVLAQTLDGSFISDQLSVSGLGDFSWYIAKHAAISVLPFLLVLWAAAYLAHFVQVGWLISPKSLQPKLSKLNPLEGFKRVFGLSALVKAAIDASKVTVVIAVVGHAVYQYRYEIVALPQLMMMQCAAEVAWMMLDVAARILAVLIVLAVIDYIYQKWKHSKDLRMTKQQVRDDLKQTEGDPEVKKRRMRMQQQIAMQRIGSAVPQADVIVTNPEHLAIAIQYDENDMAAPRVVAKGADYLALRIRQLAMQHNVPIVERKPLARALYKDVKVGQEIPPAFYQAVAEILAYVYKLGGKRAG